MCKSGVFFKNAFVDYLILIMISCVFALIGKNSLQKIIPIYLCFERIFDFELSEKVSDAFFQKTESVKGFYDFSRTIALLLTVYCIIIWEESYFSLIPSGGLTLIGTAFYFLLKELTILPTIVLLCFLLGGEYKGFMPRESTKLYICVFIPFIFLSFLSNKDIKLFNTVNLSSLAKVSLVPTFFAIILSFYFDKADNQFLNFSKY